MWAVVQLYRLYLRFSRYNSAENEYRLIMPKREILASLYLRWERNLATITAEKYNLCDSGIYMYRAVYLT